MWSVVPVMFVTMIIQWLPMDDGLQRSGTGGEVGTAHLVNVSLERSKEDRREIIRMSR